jgi:hypothetical protein
MILPPPGVPQKSVDTAAAVMRHVLFATITFSYALMGLIVLTLVWKLIYQ